MREHESVLVFSSDGKAVRYYPIKEERRGTGKGMIGKTFIRKATRSDVRPLVALESDPPRSELRYPSTVQKFNMARGKEGGKHPTQKPVSLMEYFVKTYTRPKETVLDFCMGSGSTGVACKNTGRGFIGIELEKKYFEIAKKRIDGHGNISR
jgi:site-specific DNA-methyltransferase (adenine-specific)